MAAKTGTSARSLATKGVKQKGIGPGRPRTSINDIRSDWREMMLELAQRGKGPTAWMVHLKLGHTAVNKVLEDCDEFREHWSFCRLVCQLWWEDKGAELVTGVIRGSAQAWELNMSCRFGWTKQTTVNHTPIYVDAASNTSMTRDEVDAELAKRGLPTNILEHASSDDGDFEDVSQLEDQSEGQANVNDYN
jgi:hypothetical protein